MSGFADYSGDTAVRIEADSYLEKQLLQTEMAARLANLCEWVDASWFDGED